jgi:hypothetical protein
MPAERFASGDLWSALENGGGPAAEITRAFDKLKADELAIAQRAALRLLTDAELRPLLEILTDMTLRRPTVLGFTPEAQLLAHQREGRNQIVMQIYRLIAQAKGELEPQREGYIE